MSRRPSIHLRLPAALWARVERYIQARGISRQAALLELVQAGLDSREAPSYNQSAR